MNNESKIGVPGILKMIDKLYESIGIRMDIVASPEFAFVTKSNFGRACQMFAKHLELPISVVPDFSGNFRTSGMVKNDDNTTSTIAAQVEIPGNLPWYGTPSMINFPIKITVGELKPYSFHTMTQLSHEFSHVYLYSRRDPQKESEHATDLCALMMGFTPFWAQGRKIVSEFVTDMGLYTQKNQLVQSQGYLSDEEYSAAVNRIAEIRRKIRVKRNQLKQLVSEINSAHEHAKKGLEALGSLLKFHRSNGCGIIKAHDAAMFSKMSQLHFLSDLSIKLEKAKTTTNNIVGKLKNKRVFFHSDEVAADEYIITLKSIIEQLEKLSTEIDGCINIVKRNMDCKSFEKEFNRRSRALRGNIAGLQKLEGAVKSRQAQLTRIRDLFAFDGNKRSNNIVELSDAHVSALTELITDRLNRCHACCNSVEEALRNKEFYNVDVNALTKHESDFTNLNSTLQGLLDELSKLYTLHRSQLSFSEKCKAFFYRFL